MKLEKVVSRPRVGLWVFLFIVGLVVASVMATTYNFEIFHHVNVNFEGIPWSKIIFVSLGFFGIIGSLILFFARLLREMRVSEIQADFLDRISHELRTPISTLTLISDLLKQNEKARNEVDQKLWQSHDLELSRLRTDVELLLQAARLRETRLKVNLERLNLVHWLAGKRESFEQLLGPSSKLVFVDDGRDKSIVLDPSLFELILRNLLDNARKFSLGEPRVQVETRVLNSKFIFTKKKWEISVTDQGLGFSAEGEDQLFKRFSRLEEQERGPRKNAVPGTGLGLYLSATASKAMGLTLAGHSLGEGKGARFVIQGNLE